MSVQEVLRKLGQWSLTLTPDAPAGVVAALEYFGHIAVVPGHVSPEERSDEMLDLARYVGVLRAIETTAGDELPGGDSSSAQTTLSGPGLAFWLGDEDGKGDVIESPGVTLTSVTFPNAIRALLPAHGSITEGTLYTGIAGTYSGTHTYQSPRTAIDYVCDTMGASWRVNNRGTLDAGPASSLFRTTPTCLIVRQGSGYDQALRALPGKLDTTQDAREYTTRAVVVAAALAGGTADAVTVPYLDLHGNQVRLTRILDEQNDTTLTNAPARAASALARYSGPQRSVQLSAKDFDIRGDFAPGDTVWVYDPDGALADPTNEVTFRGRTINPAAVSVLSLTWPIEDGYTVGYRSSSGTWTDLTPWVAWEDSNGGQIEVADSLVAALTPGISSIGTQVTGGGGGAGDTAIPDVPTFGTFTTGSYQPTNGIALATITATWTQPLNTDSSTIVDGDHYELRYRPTGTTNWQTAMVGWDLTSFTFVGLAPSTGYDFQIRAVDYASPINYGAWSSTTSYTSASDTTAPATPAPPTVAASLISVQVTHTLGLASGGTYNLPLDLDHLEVHVDTTSGFTPSSATLAGKLPANAGMLSAGIPAIGTFPTSSTAAVFVKVIAVDRTGNRSTASSQATATATLLDDAHISDLVVSKLTSGTMSAAVILGGSIKTATSGSRVEIDSSGVRLYDSGGSTTVDLNTGSGTATLTGTVQTGVSGSRVVMNPSNVDVEFYPSSGSAKATITGLGVDFLGGGPTSTLAWLDARSSPGQSSKYGNLTLGSYPSGTYYASAMMSARTSSDVTNGWFQILGRSNDALVSMGTANNSATVLASYVMSGSAVTATGSSYNGTFGSSQIYADSSFALVQSGSAFLRALNSGGVTMQTSGVPYISADTTNATVYAASGGNASVQNANGSYFSANGGDAYVNSGGTTYVLGTTIYLGNPSGQVVRSDATYNNTATFTANVGIATSPIGRLYRLTSSARYKVDIAPAVIDPSDVLRLEPVTYYDRGQWEAAGETTEGLSQYLGLIAEATAALPGIGRLLTELDQDGVVSSVNYDRVAVALMVVVKDLARRVQDLEAAA